jgi:dTDP-4-amino-4,6-dideoxygalactose transaminase
MIPFLDLRAQYHTIKPEIDSAVLAVLESTQYALGSAVASFEQAFAAYTQTQYCLGVNTGTSALHLALLAAGIQAGDEVITSSFTFVATVAAIEYAGARAVYVDIDPRTYNLDPNLLEQAITPKTKAIIPVHLYGQAAELDPILALAGRYGLAVIEDAAQAHGATYHKRRIGSFGDLACFSFYPGKNLGAYGEGGAVVTNNPAYAQHLRVLRDWGAERKYEHLYKGFNYRMDGVQGAVLGVKLRYLEGWTERRRAIASQYDRLFAGSGITTPWADPLNRHVYHIYAIQVDDRPTVQAALQARGIATGIHYPIPVHLQPAYRTPQFPAGSLPHTEAAAQRVLSLPMFAELTDEQVATVVAAVRAVV